MQTVNVMDFHSEKEGGVLLKRSFSLSGATGPRSSVLVYTNSRADLELKYVYAKLGTSEAYKLCPVDPPPADIDVTNPSNASIGFHSYEKVDNLISYMSTCSVLIPLLVLTSSP